MKNILIYGFYYKNNLGDDLFMEAFEYLFPDLELFFTDSISVDKLLGMDAVFFGGGSFLLGNHNISTEAVTILKTKKVFYLGVGVETDIHPVHLELMSGAQLIATRSIDQVERLRTINPNVRFIPDLVYALQDKVNIS